MGRNIRDHIVRAGRDKAFSRKEAQANNKLAEQMRKERELREKTVVPAPVVIKKD